MSLSEEEYELRMNAYYYEFDRTGVREIDMILSAVARAGKCFHSTQYWSDNDPPVQLSPFAGDCPIEWIQNAANDAARLMAASKEMLALLERAEDMTSQANGIAHVSKRLGVAAALADLNADIRALLERLKGGQP